MTQKEKKLLFKDLCARLPYHVKVKVWCRDGMEEEGDLDLEHNYGDVLKDAFYFNDIVDIKPYLRSLNSLSESELEEYESLKEDLEAGAIVPWKCSKFLDWCYKHHIDINGMIEIGLAIEVTKDNNPYKDEE